MLTHVSCAITRIVRVVSVTLLRHPRPVQGIPGVYERRRRAGRPENLFRLQYLREWREAAHLTRSQLGELAHVPMRRIARIEECPHGVLVDADTAAAFADVLGVDVCELAAMRPAEYLSQERKLAFACSKGERSYVPALVPSTRVQAVETSSADGLPELAVYLPRLWISVLCEPDGVDYQTEELAPEVAHLMAVTGLDLEPLLQIIFAEAPVSLPMAARIAQALHEPVLELARF